MQPTITLTASHHARLFTCITDSLLCRLPEDQAHELIHKAVTRYGEQRGHRMALRAQANNDPLDMVSFLAYGEWQAPRGELAMSLAERTPHATMLVSQCPWHGTWSGAGLMTQGALFCDRIDKALVKGFNPQLTVDVNRNLTRGADCCEFVFHNANLNLARLASLVWRKYIRLGRQVVMPWSYHLGHLYVSLGQTFEDELGTLTKSVMDDAIDHFFNLYPMIDTDFFDPYREMDFNLLP